LQGACGQIRQLEQNEPEASQRDDREQPRHQRPGESWCGGTRLARRARLRACLVLRGPQWPPRYRHMSHSRIAITATAHGIAGVVARLAMSRPVQMPPATMVSPKARRPAQMIVGVRGLRERMRVAPSSLPPN
jgi:hypothetical protein